MIESGVIKVEHDENGELAKDENGKLEAEGWQEPKLLSFTVR